MKYYRNQFYKQQKFNTQYDIVVALMVTTTLLVFLGVLL